MKNVLRGIQNEICLFYLDDIIYSTSLKEHILRFNILKFRSVNSKIQLDKTEFYEKK